MSSGDLVADLLLGLLALDEGDTDKARTLLESVKDRLEKGAGGPEASTARLTAVLERALERLDSPIGDASDGHGPGQ
jgi:hypothetical protein